MKKNYICPTVLLVNVEDEIILAGSPPKVTTPDIPSGPSTGDDDDPAKWADAKGGHGGFTFDDDFSDDLNW